MLDQLLFYVYLRICVFLSVYIYVCFVSGVGCLETSIVSAFEDFNVLKQENYKN